MEKKQKYHAFTVKVMRAPPGAQPFVFKVLNTGQSKREAFFEVYGRIFICQQQCENQPLLPFMFDEEGLKRETKFRDKK